MKPDERQFWQEATKARPDHHGLIYFGPIGDALVMAPKRVMYLCRKWDRQGRVELFGPTTGKIIDAALAR